MAHVAYESDYYGWTQEQAALLREGRINQLDLQNLAEEIEDMGKAAKRSLRSHLHVLLAHLLKWEYQPHYPYKRSWELTIDEQRDSIIDLLADNLGLTPKIPELTAFAYRSALRSAEKETGLPQKTFPKECPWGFEQMTNFDYWPGLKESDDK